MPFARRGLIVLIGAAALTLMGLSVAAAAPSTQAGTTHAKVTKLCHAPKPGHAACYALRQVSPSEPSALKADGVSPHATPSGYGPSDLRSAYALTATGSSSRTVAIVDAYDDPNAESDLATYRA